MKRMILYLSFVSILFSCSDEHDDMLIPEEENINSESYVITESEAIANLTYFLLQVENFARNSIKSVKRVTPVRLSRTESRSTSNVDNENLLYVAEFENKEGFAILSADYRIPVKVLTITESGGISYNII